MSKLFSLLDIFWFWIQRDTWYYGTLYAVNNSNDGTVVRFLYYAENTTVCKRQKLSIIRLYMQSYKRHLLWLECMTCCKKVNWSTLKPYFSGRNKESVAASESIHSLENKSPYPRDKRWKDELRRQWTRPFHLYLLNWPDWD